MSREKLPDAYGDAEFVRAFLKQIHATEKAHGVGVDVEILESGQRGVLSIFLVAIDLRSTHNLARAIVRYRTQYPGSQAKNLAACLFQAAQTFDTQVYDYRKTEDATSAPRWD